MPHSIHAAVCDTKLLLMAGSGSEPFLFLKYLNFAIFVNKVISNFLMYLFIYLYTYRN
jgi:hypothetical protein